jgi:hypothetical protein
MISYLTLRAMKIETLERDCLPNHQNISALLNNLPGAVYHPERDRSRYHVQLEHTFVSKRAFGPRRSSNCKSQHSGFQGLRGGERQRIES